MCKDEQTTEIVEARVETAIAAPDQVTANGLLQMAIDKDLDVEKLRMLMDLKDRDDATQAKKAYMAAMTRFHATCPEIIKTRTVDFTSQKGRTNYNHAGLAETLEQIKGAMTECGLFASWRTDVKDGIVTVTCVVTHADGHSETTALPGSPDNSGNKNPIQAVGSTVTYLQRYTLFVLLGLAALDQDDDGNAPGETITEEQAVDLALRLDKIPNASLAQFLKPYRVEKLADLPASLYEKAEKRLAKREAEVAT